MLKCGPLSAFLTVLSENRGGFGVAQSLRASVEQLETKSSRPSAKSLTYAAMDVETAIPAYADERRAQVSPRMVAYWLKNVRPLAAFRGLQRQPPDLPLSMRVATSCRASSSELSTRNGAVTPSVDGPFRSGIRRETIPARLAAKIPACESFSATH